MRRLSIVFLVLSAMAATASCRQVYVSESASLLETMWSINVSANFGGGNDTFGGDHSSVGYSGGALVVANPTFVAAFNATNGTNIWEAQQASWGTTVDKVAIVDPSGGSSPGVVVVSYKNSPAWSGSDARAGGASNSNYENIYVFNMGTGQLIFSFQQQGKAPFAHTGAAGILVRVQDEKFLVGYMLVSGQVLFNVSHSLPNLTTIEIGRTTVTTVHYPNGMSGAPYNSQFDVRTGVFLCGFNTVQFLPSPTAAGDLVFGGSPFQFLHDARTCSRHSRALVYLPYAVGSTWYYVTESNQLQRFHNNGSLAWSVPINPAALPTPWTTNFAATQYQPGAFVEAEYLGAGQIAVFAVRNATNGKPLWISNVSVQTTPASTVLPLGSGQVFLPAFLGGYSILDTAGSGMLVERNKAVSIKNPQSFLDPAEKPFVVWMEADGSLVAKRLSNKS